MESEQGPRMPDAPDRKAVGKLIEDPYFQYLVGKQARAQSWAFLGLIGSIVGAVILYGGWEFKSAKAEIDKQKTQIEQESEKARQSSEQVQTANRKAQELIDKAEEQLRFAKEYREESQRRSDAMAQAIQANIDTAGDLQTKFYNYQQQLLNSVSVIVQNAKDSADKIQASVKKLDDAEIDRKLEKITDDAGNIDGIVARISNREKEITDASRNVTELANNVSRLAGELKDVKTIQSNIQRAKLNELVLLTTHRERTLYLRDPDSNASYSITFYCSGIGSRQNLEIRMRVVPSDTLATTETTAKIDVAEERLSPKPHEIRGTPFGFKFDFAYHAIMSDDFVALRVVPNG